MVGQHVMDFASGGLALRTDSAGAVSTITCAGTVPCPTVTSTAATVANGAAMVGTAAVSIALHQKDWPPWV